MSKNVKDYEVTEVIPLDYKVGVEFEYDGCKFRSTKNKEQGKYVELEISSYVGISIGAQHTYGHFKLPHMYAECLANPKKSVYWKVGTHCGGSVTDVLEEIWKIDITRPVTQKDKKMDGGETFRAYPLNSPTDRFDTEVWLIDKAKREFKRIFGPGWILYREKMRKINKPNEREFWETYKEILVKADDRPKPEKVIKPKIDKKQFKLKL